MGKIKTKSYKYKVEKDGKTVFVYGEMRELPYQSGIAQVFFTPKGRVIKGVSDKILVSTCDNTHGKIREFNMGWCICQGGDKFDQDLAISICKRRFSRSPLRTQNGMWLNEDMCNVIVSNEALYICEHMDKFENYFTNRKKKA